MKKLISLFFIFLIACQNNSNPDFKNSIQQTDSVKHTPVISDSVNVLKEATPIKNQKDNDGKKQGIWDYYENRILKGFKTYKNDTLEGYYQYWITYSEGIIEGYFNKGKKEGIEKSYYNYSKRELFYISNYKNDKRVWTGFPHLANNYFPVKGFNIESDSIFIECPFENDTTWYTGLVIHKEPVGIHKMYYPNGKLKFEVDYSLKTVKEFDSTGTLLSKKKKEHLQSWNK